MNTLKETVLKESCHKKTNLLHVPSETARKLYYYVQWTGHFVCKPDFYIKRSYLDSYLLLYVVSGSGTLNYKGKSYMLGKNSIVLIDCKVPQEYYPDCDRWEFKYIHFNGSQSKMYYEHITALYNAPVTIGNVETEKYFDKICELIRSSSAEEICSELIYHLLINLINSHSCGSEEKSEAFRIKDVLMYISDHYASDLNVTRLAEIAHLSRCHFSTEFKRHTGFSPYCYILKYRLSAAKRLLCSTERTVDIIAERCGFADTSSFIRAFKKVEGISPAAYRKTH